MFGRGVRAVSLPAQNPTGDASGVSFGAATPSGQVVTADTALRLADVYACVRVIADAVSTLPLLVYRRGAGGRDRADETLAGRLLRRPSPVLTQSALVGSIAASLQTTGNAFVAKLRASARGPVVQLAIIEPDRVCVEVEAGEPHFDIRPRADGTGFSGDATRRDVIHVKAMTLDGIVGVSPITMARAAIGIGMSLEEYAGRLLGDGAMPAGILTSDRSLSPDQKRDLRESWNRMHQGPRRAGRPALLEGGVRYEPTTLSPADAQFVDQRRFSATQIARIFRVPPHMIGADSGSSMTYANTEQASLEFVTFTLAPTLTAIEQAIGADEDLFDQAGVLYPEFLVDGLLRSDTATRYQAYAASLGGGGKPGWRTPNEVRQLDNLPALAGGDELAPAQTKTTTPAGGSAA